MGWCDLANLSRHLTFSAAGSGILAATYLGADLATVREAMAFWVAGTVGGLLPDVDSDHSAAVKGLFTALGALTAVLAMASLAPVLSVLELWGVCLLSYCLVRYAALRLFRKLTVHRGVVHSVATACLLFFASTTVCVRVLGMSSSHSWTLGAYLFLGYLFHLVLDEVSSVDLANVRIKSSFGTALKLVDTDYPVASLLVVAAAVATFVASPDIGAWETAFLNGHRLQALIDGFSPAMSWGPG